MVQLETAHLEEVVKAPRAEWRGGAGYKGYYYYINIQVSSF